MFVLIEGDTAIKRSVHLFKALAARLTGGDFVRLVDTLDVRTRYLTLAGVRDFEWG